MERKGVSVIAIVILIIVIAVVGVGAYFLLKGGGGAFGDAYIAGLLDENGNLTANGGTTTQRIQYIKGTVTNPQAGQAALTAMAMSLSSQTTFNGKIYLKFNGSDEEIPVYDDGTHEDATAGDGIWTFKEARVLISGTNTFQITVKNLAGDIIAQSEVFTVNADIPVMDIWMQLTWDTDQTDVDLHVWDSDNAHTYYAQKTGIPGAELDVDDVDGYGPEHFTMQSAQAGNYVVKVRYYSAHGVAENTTATVRISIAGGAYHTYTHTFTPDDVTTETSYDTAYGYDWHVATLSMTGTGGGTVTAGS